MPGEQKPSIGRVVHYVLPADARYPGEHRPALIVKVWNDSSVNLQVFVDGVGFLPKFLDAVQGKQLQLCHVVPSFRSASRAARTNRSR